MKRSRTEWNSQTETITERPVVYVVTTKRFSFKITIHFSFSTNQCVYSWIILVIGLNFGKIFN